MIEIVYNTDDLMVNAPHGANLFYSCQNWARQVKAAALKLGLDCRDVYEDSDLPDVTWHVDGYITAEDYRELIHEIDRITDGDWYDYRPQEDDRW